jgi:hypothetical protein
MRQRKGVCSLLPRRDVSTGFTAVGRNQPMQSWQKPCTYLMLASIGMQTLAMPSTLSANPVEKIMSDVHDLARHISKKDPLAPQDVDVERVAREIDWLEDKIECFGSVVPKQPDIWGEARMTKHRQEVERELAKKLGEFDETLQAAIRRSDQSYLSAAFTLNAALATNGAAAPSESASTDATTITETTLELTGDPNSEKQTFINRTGASQIDLSESNFAKTSLSLEPTIVNEQLNRYLHHLNELRRINEGDDTSDSPGYALNLVRLPISVLPGKMTRSAYGAEISFTATPYLGEDLLPSTIRSLIINDVVSLNSLPVSQLLLNDPEEGAKHLRNFREREVRLSLWTAAFDGWLSRLQMQSEQVDNHELSRTLDFFHANRTYLTNRLMQIAIRAPESEQPASRPIVNEDFAYTYVDELDPSQRIGVTFYSIAKWLDEVSANDKSLFELHDLGIYLNSGGGWAKVIDLPTRLRCPDEINSDFSKSRSVPLFFDKEAIERLFLSEKQSQAIVQAATILRSFLTNQGDVNETKNDSGDSKDSQIKYANEISNKLDRWERDSGGLPILDYILPVGLATRPGHVERPLASSQYLTTYGFEGFMQLALAADSVLSMQPAKRATLTILDVRSYLQEEVTTAYAWLEQPANASLWHDYCTPALAAAIDARDVKTVNLIRGQFFANAQVATERSEIGVLAWGIIVDAARLNQRLIKDMQHVAQSKGCSCVCGEGMQFIGPKELISPEANEAFKQYVMCRWPIQVFALDPVTQDQNVADVFSRRREMQLALAVGVSTGEVSAGSAMRWARRLETDIETIALNRTAVAFSHGSDTFGWRFYPRVQTPDTPGTLGAFRETLCGGPTRDADIRDRQLEPGIRECVAVILMPSFVPYVTFESRGSYFGLTNPKKKVLTMEDTLKISRNYQQIRRDLQVAQETCVYRPGDVSHLTSVVGQMEKRLPLQSCLVQIPFENTLGGFEMFNTGVTDLAPELHGWYGAPGVVVGDGKIDCNGVTFGTNQCQGTCNATTLFLVGGRFSVHETKVIAGGKCVPYELISREIMRVSIPQDVQAVQHDTDKSRWYVDVHVATPYGVTSHLLINAIRKEGEVEKKVEVLSEKVTAADAQIAKLTENFPSFTAPKLAFEANFEKQNPGNLTFARKTDGSALPVKFFIPGLDPVTITSPVKMAVRYNGQFISPGFDVVKLPTPIVIENGATLKLDLDAIMKEIAFHLETPQSGITRSNFKDNKTTATAWLYYSPPNAADVRIFGEVEIDVTLGAECGAPATTSEQATPTESPAKQETETMPSPAEPVPAKPVSSNCDCALNASPLVITR